MSYSRFPASRPSLYDQNRRPIHPLAFANPLYPYHYSPYPYTPLASPAEYLPANLLPASRWTSSNQQHSQSHDDFYQLISGVYKMADQPELDRLLTTKVDEILTADPFSKSIEVDFGFGALPRLEKYGIEKSLIRYQDAVNIDSLYLFEATLRADQLLTDPERLRRWAKRMNWEQIPNADKQESWFRFSSLDQRQISIGPGSWWANRLFGMPIDATYGYSRLLVGDRGVFTSTDYRIFRKGAFQTHYPLSGDIKAHLPMWRDGGLGLGRSLIAWVEGRPTLQTSGGDSNKPEYKSSKSNTKATGSKWEDAEVANRRFDAERRVSSIINNIRATTLVKVSPQIRPWQYNNGAGPLSGSTTDERRKIYEQVSRNNPSNVTSHSTPSAPYSNHHQGSGPKDRVLTPHPTSGAYASSANLGSGSKSNTEPEGWLTNNQSTHLRNLMTHPAGSGASSSNVERSGLQAGSAQAGRRSTYLDSRN